MSKPAPKKQKQSDMSQADLTQLKTILKRVQSSIPEVEAKDEGDRPDEQLGLDTELCSQLEAIIGTVHRKLTQKYSVSFSSMDKRKLRDLKINFGSSLTLKENYIERCEQSKQLGGDSYMSSELFYKYLDLIGKVVPRNSEASARMWIDAYFLRVASMAPTDKRVIVTVEHHCESIEALPDISMYIGGTVDYSALCVDDKDADQLMKKLRISDLKTRKHSGFFVGEGKLVILQDHIPQILGEMFACAKHVNQDIFRGVLTDGMDWIFIILFLDKEGGATYWESETIRVPVAPSKSLRPGPIKVLRPFPDAITGILLQWVQDSYSDISDSDWFTKAT